MKIGLKIIMETIMYKNIKLKNNTMKKFITLKAGQDFRSCFSLNHLKLNDVVITKMSVATGWATIGKVTRITKTQVEVETTNIIPTWDRTKWTIKNPFKTRGSGFFENWNIRKQICIGKKEKFFKDSGVRVGDSNEWNPRKVCSFENSLTKEFCHQLSGLLC